MTSWELGWERGRRIQGGPEDSNYYTDPQDFCNHAGVRRIQSSAKSLLKAQFSIEFYLILLSS